MLVLMLKKVYDVFLESNLAGCKKQLIDCILKVRFKYLASLE